MRYEFFPPLSLLRVGVSLKRCLDYARHDILCIRHSVPIAIGRREESVTRKRCLNYALLHCATEDKLDMTTIQYLRFVFVLPPLYS